MDTAQLRNRPGTIQGAPRARTDRGDVEPALRPPKSMRVRFAPIDDEVVQAHAERRVADHSVFVAGRVLESIQATVRKYELEIARSLGPVSAAVRHGRSNAGKLATAAEVVLADATAAAMAAAAREGAATAAYPWAGADPATIFTMADGIQRPVTVSPSGQWGFYTPPACRPQDAGPVAGLAWTDDEGRWVGAPGYHARTMAAHDATRPFGYVERASLSVQDTAAYVAYACDLLTQEQAA